MSEKTKILILEHESSDIELIHYELAKSGIHYEFVLVQNEKDFRTALKDFNPDIILSDYSLPTFDGPAAFKIKENISPGTPFILVSGTVGEEIAVELIRSGVTDYVLKDKLFTLPPKISRALKEVEVKKEKIIADEKLNKANNLNSFIGQVNQNIVRVKDEATLFRNSCQLAIEFGKFRMSWIGLFDFENKKISLIEQCGVIDEDLLLFVDAPYQATGPQDYVLRTGTYFICNDIQNDLELISWKPFALKRGINSCMVLPIKKSGMIVGTFNLYSSELNFSGIEEIRLLVEVADDISFALDLFEKAEELKKTSELVINNEKKFRHTLDNMLEGIQIHDFNFRYLYANDVLVKSSTYSRDELIGFTLMEKYPGIEQSDLFKSIQHCLKERVAQHLETTFTFADGSKTDFELSIEPIPEGVTILSIDRTEQNKAKEKLLKVNRLYAFISAVNQSIVHIDDEQLLLNNACKIAVDIGQFKMAWIDLIDEQSGKLNVVSRSGIQGATEASLRFSGKDHKDPVLNGTPTGMVLSTGQFAVSNDLQNDPSMSPWKKELVENGIKAGMSLPLKKFGKLVGIFGFYSAVENIFDAQEIALLEEATGDISFALENFEKAKRHKVTEELVLKNERRFRALVEQGTDAVAIFSPTGGILYVSPSVEKILGYTEEDAMKLDMFSLVHPDDIPGLSQVWERVIASPGIPIPGYTGRLKHKNGSWRWLEATATNMLHDPSINGIVDNFRDVTERIEAEVQREFEKNNLDALINNTSDLMWSVDRDYNLITSNIPFEEMSKLNFGRVIAKGESVLAVSHTPEMQNQFKQIYERAFKGETFTEVAYFDIPFEFWSEISYYPIRKGEEIIGTACHSRDITPTKLSERSLLKSEANLIQSEAKLNEAQAIAHLGNWEMNFVTQQAIWSDEACRIYDLPLTEKTQTYADWLSFIHPEDVAYVMTANKQGEETLSDTILNHRIVLKSGRIKHIYAKSKFKFNQEGKPIGLYGIVLDVTDRKLADEEREKMIDSIVQHSKNLEQFASIVSHNLRAPVANILGLANVLKSSISKVDRERAQEYLFTATRSLDEIVTDLNKILQVRSEIDEYKEVVYFEELVTSIKSSIHSVIEKEKIQIVTDFGAVDKIMSIKSYVYSIFYNLISNAIKYRQEGKAPLISIRTELTKNRIKIFFKDNGVGIDLIKYGDQLFGLYKRFQLNIEGKGMGLFMIKTQIETLGGTIKAESKPNEGAEFIIELPCLIKDQNTSKINFNNSATEHETKVSKI